MTLRLVLVAANGFKNFFVRNLSCISLIITLTCYPSAHCS